jgi:hypothetical protein
MEHDLLETTTPERFVLEIVRPRFFTMLTGPDQLTTDSRNTPPRTNLIPWQRFGTLLQSRGLRTSANAVDCGML